jgi:diguanylate cyclase (GGDEF)-like protein
MTVTEPVSGRTERSRFANVFTHAWRGPRFAAIGALVRAPWKSRFARTIRPVLPECLAIVGLLALIWFSTGEILSREHSHELEAARGMTEAVSKAFSETTTRIVSEIDQTLLNVRASYSELGPDFDIDKWAASQTRHDQMRVQITIIDNRGMSVKSTLAQTNTNPISIADRPHFRYHLDPSHDDIYISDPVVGRGSGEKTIQFSRRLMDHNGRFAGVVVLSLSCAELSEFYNTSGTYEGTVALISDRGMIMATGAEQANLIGTIVATAPPPRAAAPDAGGPLTNFISWRTAEGLVNYRRLARYPLTVMVEKSEAQIYQGFWATARNFIVVAAVASSIVVLLGGFWILQRRRAAQASHALAATLAGVTQGIMMVDANRVVSVSNVRALSLLGVQEAASAGPAALNSIDRLIANGRPQHTATSGQPAAKATECQILESTMHSGQVVEIRTTPLPNGDTIHTLTDITERHRAQSHIRYLAHHDVLTGLPNRALLEEKVVQTLAEAGASGRQVMVMFIDLDGFKGVNDTLGHLTGDLLLKHVAQVIGSSIGPHDFVARLGGDEFIVVRSDVNDVDAAAELAGLLIDRISDSVIIDDRELRVSTSVGISVFPRDGVDHHVLFRKADIALYRAKGEGRATYRIFEHGMDERLHRRMMLEEDLRHALNTGALQVHFQPEFESDSLRIAGFEALARWEHPKHGWVLPEMFISVAEEAGLITRLGAFVLERACEQALQWPEDCFVAVNVSAIQLHQAGFMDVLRGVLARTGLPPHRLELELTESVMTDSGRQTVATLTAIRELGISLALDDFGTGYSSLSNLLRFHFDKVKIDKSFIQEQHRDAEARAILEAILAMSRHIGLKVTAEGVETEEQFALLRRQGCTLIQGYLLGRSMTGAAVLDLLAGVGTHARDAATPDRRLLVATDAAAN